MLKATVYRCARHQSVHRTLIFLFQCVCVVTLFSTACYIVDIRSRYRTPRHDFNALHFFSEVLWNSSALPKSFAATPKLRLTAIQTRDGLAFDNVKATFTRTSGQDAATADYGLERTECMWSALPDPGAELSATPAGPPVHLHIFFLHGNAGSHTQGEFWSCAAQYTGRMLGVRSDTYAFEWAEQANVHRGRLVSLQADYVADVVEAVVLQAMRHTQTAAMAGGGGGRRNTSHHVWFVAHSMGGVVARLAAQLLDPSIVLGGVLTFNSPARFPPLLLDSPMAAVYRTLALAERRPAATPRAHPAAAAPQPAALRNASKMEVKGLSSEMLMEACSEMPSECVALQRLRRQRGHVPHLISITSGEMDLQIESTTTYPVYWRSQYVVSFFNTLDRAVCTYTTSHDGILGEPCAVTLGALHMFSASLAPAVSSAAPFDDDDDEPGGRRLDANTMAQLPLPPGVVSRVSMVGRLLWQQHMWPWAVVALYSYVLLAGLWPQAVDAVDMLALKWTTKGGRLWRLASTVRWAFPKECTVPVFLAFFYSCTCGYATALEVYLVCTGQRDFYSAVYPWQWESYPQLRYTTPTLTAPVQLCVFTTMFFFLSVGPVTVGTNAAMALVVIGDLARHVKSKVGRCSLLFSTARRRRAFTLLFPVAVAGLYVVCLLCQLELAVRAMLWLLLFLVLPSFRLVQVRREEKAGNPLSIDSPKSDPDVVEVVFPPDVASTRVPLEVEEWHAHHVPGMLYATLYLIQLHPFFALRNVVVSHTHDDVATVDLRNYVAEAGLLVLLCCATVTPPLLKSRYRCVSYASAVASLGAMVAVSWIVVHPVESYHVLPALLWCLPSFLLSTLFV